MSSRLIAVMASLLMAVAADARAACKIGVYGELPLEPRALYQAVVPGEVNGQPSAFILDTGAWASLMPYANAAHLKVKADSSAFAYTGYDIKSEGVGGRQETGAVAFDMKIGSIFLPKEVMTAVPMHSLGDNVAALVGRDLLAQHDLELDVPDHQVRLLRVNGCSAEELDYWNKPYSIAKLEDDGSGRSAILVQVLLNGHVVPAMLDSGAAQTVVTPEAARAAGASVDMAHPLGRSRGIGDKEVDTQSARFASFALGDEVVHDVSIQVAPLWQYNKLEETGTRLGSQSHDMFQPKMLIGYDFLRSHRVLVANSMKLLVFSYLGGPVFGPPAAAAAAAAPHPQVAGAR